jgi:hypothetical protein
MNGVEHSKAQPTDPTIRQGEISIIFATRGRPELLVDVFNSLGRNTAKKDLTSVWIYVDDDDTATLQAIEKKIFPDAGIPVHWHVAPRTGGLGECHQALYKASGRTSQVYVTTVDDAQFDTPGWDDVVRAKYDEYPDGVLLAFPHDPNTADQATYPILGWGWLKALGHVYPGYFPYWFDDKWVDEIGRMVGRCAKLAFDVRPIRGGKGRTKRMRNHAFWTRFFVLMLEERKESARKLIAAMFPGDDAKRAQALKELEETSKKFEAEKEKFSDVYCAFQEERHTEMSPEERLQFDAKNFRQEALIVSRLITRARELMGQKRFAEAVECLDCVKYSDLRVRQAHVLMAECLRQLGRAGEAEKISLENLAAWPQMNVVRRGFRFLGMVANDGKRMLVGLSEKKKKTG